MEKLTSSEEEAMQAVWRVRDGNVKAFMESLDTQMPYTTFASIIKNLEKKGFLKSRLLGNTFFYTATVTESAYKQKFMQGVVKDYFDNSYKELVSFFVDNKKLSAKELKEIISMIEKK